MQHTRQDAVGTAARRKSDQRRAWHPMLAAREPEPGVWYMVVSMEKCCGIIRRGGGQVGCRAVTWASDPAERLAIGYYGRCATHARQLTARSSNPAPELKVNQETMRVANLQVALCCGPRRGPRTPEPVDACSDRQNEQFAYRGPS